MFSGKQRRDADAAGEEVVHEGGFLRLQFRQQSRLSIEPTGKGGFSICNHKLLVMGRHNDLQLA